jgi:phenylacetate-CoA ligase
VPLLNRYGGRELSTMACQFEPGGPLWVMRPWLFLEIVDERGKPVPPGQSGRLIWTSTICRGTPFLRYEIEDLGMADSPLQDESGIRGIAQLQGRTAGLIQLADGRRINNIYWNHLFKEFPEVRQFQVIVRGTTSFRLLLKGTPFTPEREAQVRRILQDFLGAFRLEEIRWVEQIPRTSQGKLIQVVRESA